MRATEPISNHTAAASERPFFDGLAAAYMILANPEQRLPKEMPFLKRWCGDAGTILDAGCGPGHHAAALLQSGPRHRRVIGFDISQAMLGEARQIHRHPRLQFIHGDLADPPTGLFDRILIIGNGLNLLPDLATVEHSLAALADCLRIAGRLLVHCHCPDDDRVQHITRHGRYDQRPLTVHKTLIPDQDGAVLSIEVHSSTVHEKHDTRLLGLEREQLLHLARQAGLRPGSHWQDLQQHAWTGGRCFVQELLP